MIENPKLRVRVTPAEAALFAALAETAGARDVAHLLRALACWGLNYPSTARRAVRATAPLPRGAAAWRGKENS